MRLRVLMEKQQRIEIGERLRALRESSPHTNRSIADEVGVGERAVANWISGSTGMTYKNAAKVARLFDVDVVWLWSGQGEQIPGTEEPPSRLRGPHQQRNPAFLVTSPMGCGPASFRYRGWIP